MIMDNLDFKIKHELMRRELWSQVWVSAVASRDFNQTRTCTEWADVAVREFDSRFKTLEIS